MALRALAGSAAAAAGAVQYSELLDCSIDRPSFTPRIYKADKFCRLAFQAAHFPLGLFRAHLQHVVARLLWRKFTLLLFVWMPAIADGTVDFSPAR
jgi:hypothetical protein